ncbi:hypothetical protein [Cellulomonas sp. B6]|uniref:hypothetical protein n=1 Tax=Cellulomonas sp. B6 TaxID=1295626 RepID=UPI00073C6930|nr:hypothetical protein [Cellulomonas sp. B6]KSW30181.1 hypothetical protein ATM99_04410 [Cellulomonas sp. B6]
MISRYHLRCPGCTEVFVARVGVEPTSGTRFYLPCPHCALPIRGSISGHELNDLRIGFEGDLVSETEPEVATAPTVTVNPFVPSLYEADSFSPLGAFPTMTLLRLLGDEGFDAFETERHWAFAAIEQAWPNTRILFQYMLQDNARMFSKIAKEKFALEWEPATAHQRTSVAYQALGLATTAIVGKTGSASPTIVGRFGRKHTAAMRRESHLLKFRERGALAKELERDVFTAINRFIDEHESWEMGRLIRFMRPEVTADLDTLVLYRDEFSIVRDLYQQGFELSCKCIWPLVAAQNSVIRGDPDDFGDAHPDVVPLAARPTNLTKFDKLPNAYKVAYAAQVPGWDSFGDLLSNRHRNAIGHATAHHELRTGRVVSDRDRAGVSYLDFLGLTFGVFEALTALIQVLRAARVASSPDFHLE